VVVHPESHTLTPPGAGVHNGWRDAGVSSPKLRAVFGVNLTSALSSLGYLAVALFVGIESIGVPLPGETMLITAAAYAGATHRLNIVAVIAVAAAAAIVLRRFGRYVRLDEAKLKVGRYIFNRRGGSVVFFGRFVSVLRTYAAFLAGVNHMRWPHFLFANAAGGICWATLYGVAAYYLGEKLVQLSRPFQLAFAAAGVAVFIASVLFIRSHAKRLEAAAEAAYPGPLEGFTE
jgi:membrane protein DedA with SNARE-associated domain